MQTLPKWATPITAATLCDCGLPAIASIPVTGFWAKGKDYKTMPVCPACLMLEQAARGEVKYQAAVQVADRFCPPLRLNMVYTFNQFQRRVLTVAHYPVLLRWERLDWLKVIRGLPIVPPGRAGITHKNAILFLTNPATWGEWQPADLRDAEMAQWAGRYRAAIAEMKEAA